MSIIGPSAHFIAANGVLIYNEDVGVHIIKGSLMSLKKAGKKVVIRPYHLSDYQSWKTAYLFIKDKKRNNWDISPRKESELALSEFKKLLKLQNKNREDDYFYDFGIFLKDGTLVGGVSLMDISRQVFQNAYLGYRVFNNHWGMGYGKEAVGLAIQMAFKTLKLHRVEAGIDPGNKRSQALARSLKMRRESLSKKRIFLGGKWLDLELYVMTSEDYGIKWKPGKKKIAHRF